MPIRCPIGERTEVEQNQNVKMGVGAWSPPAAHLRSCRVPPSMLSKRLSPLSTNFAAVLLPGWRTSIPFLPNLRQPVTVDRLPLHPVEAAFWTPRAATFVRLKRHPG